MSKVVVLLGLLLVGAALVAWKVPFDGQTLFDRLQAQRAATASEGPVIDPKVDEPPMDYVDESARRELDGLVRQRRR